MRGSGGDEIRVTAAIHPGLIADRQLDLARDHNAPLVPMCVLGHGNLDVRFVEQNLA